MSMDLDKRQRAMLREMGIKVWQPQAAPLPTMAANAAPPLPAAEPFVVHAPKALETASPQTSQANQAKPVPAQVARLVPAPQPDGRAQSVSSTPEAGGAWHLGGALTLYTPADPAKGARWLVVAETPAAALQFETFNPFEGDAGKLLDNMLRALRLHQEGTVMLAPLVRRVAPDAHAATALPALLAKLITQAQPDVVLVMGRLAAQALLQSREPFGKLRGQIHSLHSINTIVTHDATYLLRTPSEKTKVWDDLCLALSVVAT